MQPRVGIVGILLGVGCDTRGQNRSQEEKGFGVLSVMHHCGASIPTGLQIIDQPCSLALALLFLIFLLISDLILDLAC